MSQPRSARWRATRRPTRRAPPVISAVRRTGGMGEIRRSRRVPQLLPKAGATASPEGEAVLRDVDLTTQLPLREKLWHRALVVLGVRPGIWSRVDGLRKNFEFDRAGGGGHHPPARLERGLFFPGGTDDVPNPAHPDAHGRSGRCARRLRVPEAPGPALCRCEHHLDPLTLRRDPPAPHGPRGPRGFSFVVVALRRRRFAELSSALPQHPHGRGLS